jgi:hypothetical protein
MINYGKLWIELFKKIEEKTSWGKEQLKKLMTDMEITEARKDANEEG